MWGPLLIGGWDYHNHTADALTRNQVSPVLKDSGLTALIGPAWGPFFDRGWWRRAFGQDHADSEVAHQLMGRRTSTMPRSLSFALEIGESFMNYLRRHLSAGGDGGLFCSKKGLRMPSGLQNLELKSLDRSFRSGELVMEQDPP